MNSLKIAGDIRKVARTEVSEGDLFHILDNKFAVGGGAVAASPREALSRICDATYLFSHAYICRLPEREQVKIDSRMMGTQGLACYTPMLASYGFESPVAISAPRATTTQAEFIENFLWECYPNAVALSFVAAVRVRRVGFAGSMINGSVAAHSDESMQPNSFDTDPLRYLPDFQEGYMWVTGITTDLSKINGNHALEPVSRAFYYLKDAEPKGMYRHHCHGLITTSLPKEWLSPGLLDWTILDRSAQTFLASRSTLDDFPVHLSDSCEMDFIKLAVWVHTETDVSYEEKP